MHTTSERGREGRREGNLEILDMVLHYQHIHFQIIHYFPYFNYYYRRFSTVVVRLSRKEKVTGSIPVAAFYSLLVYNKKCFLL